MSRSNSLTKFIILLLSCLVLFWALIPSSAQAVTEDFSTDPGGALPENSKTYNSFVYSYRNWDPPRALTPDVFWSSVDGVGDTACLATDSLGDLNGRELDIARSGGGTFTFKGLTLCSFTNKNISGNNVTQAAIVYFQGYKGTSKAYDSGPIDIPECFFGTSPPPWTTYAPATVWSGITELRIVSTTDVTFDPFIDDFEYFLLPAPTVTGISPSSGSTAGGTGVTIGGTGFVDGATVAIGGTSATGVTVVNDTTITATTPAGTAGAKDLVVTNPDTQTGTLAGGFTYASAPTVTTQAASSISSTAATGNGNITATNGTNATTRGVIYYPYTNTDKIIGDAGITNMSESGDFTTGAFTASLTPLSVNTQYNARAYATSPNGTGYGARVAFWTLANVPAAPTVNNPTATTMDVTINPNGNPATTEFCIQETSTSNYVQAGGTLGAGSVWQTAAVWLTKTVTGLTTGSTYTFQVKARNGGSTETAFGATASGVPVAAPTVTTQAASSISSTAATGNGNITATNGANATARGVIYWGYNNSDQIIGDGGVTDVSEAASFGTGAFTAALTPLSVNTQYNARAYAINPYGTGYGARVAFWTLANVPSAPTVNNPTATTLAVAVNVNGNPAGTEFCIQETSTSNYVQADGTLAGACVWQNVATWGAKTVTGLTTGNTYTFQVKARNGGLTETAYGPTASLTACATSATVTNNGDIGAGSLRQAIAESCSGGTINFNGDYTIPLASTLTIDKNLTITGAGHTVTVSGGGLQQVFLINLGVTAATIDSLIIRDGNAGSDNGGGIYNLGALTISNSTFSGNRTAIGSGGGIYNFGALTISNSTFSGNTASSGGGGGIYNAGTVMIQHSIFSGNSAPAGGGLFNGRTVMIQNSTFSGNTASRGDGGGILNVWAAASLSVINSTFSGNTATAAGGGGIANYNNATATTMNSTFSANSATNGGGVYVESGTVSVLNTIITNSPSGGDCRGTVSGSSINNLLQQTGSDACGLTNGVNIIGGNPLLSPLGSYGGPTQTFALLPGSPAIDAGDNATCAALPVGNLDQRGISRPQGSACDIGAFESQGFTFGVPTGTPQSTVINTAFATQLSVPVTSAFGEPVDGGIVTFTAPSSGASVTFAPTTNATITSGAASLAVTANGTVGGPYSVTTASNGVSGTPAFSLTNTLIPSTTTVTSSTNPSVFGQSVTFTATVTTGATGTVDFTEGALIRCSASPIAGTTATCNVSSLSVGTHAITATYNGDANYAVSSGTMNQVVNAANTITTIATHDPNPSAMSQAVAVSYTVAPVAPGAGTPTGNVTVSDGEGHSCTGTLTLGSGSCNITLTTSGIKTLAASYGGDAGFNASSGAAGHPVLINKVLSVTKTGSGTVTSDLSGVEGNGINCGADCSETYMHGTVVTLTATPANGWALSGWSGDPDCSDGQVTLDADKTCAAAFTLATSITIPAATGNGNITLTTSSPGCGFYNVSARTEAQVGNDPDFNYPYGLVEFTLNCASADVTITFPGTITGIYRKYGPTTPGDTSTTKWYPFNNVTINGSNTITLHLEDGQLGDDTGVEGTIVDQGGPALPAAGTVDVPTMNEWGMIIFGCLAGLASALYLRRRKAER